MEIFLHLEKICKKYLQTLVYLKAPYQKTFENPDLASLLFKNLIYEVFDLKLKYKLNILF